MDQQENLKLAKQELEIVCQKYDVALIPVVIHRGNDTVSSIDLVPRSVFRNQQQQPAVEQTQE